MNWGREEAHYRAFYDALITGENVRGLLVISLRIYRGRGEHEKARELLAQAKWFRGTKWKS